MATQTQPNTSHWEQMWIDSVRVIQDDHVGCPHGKLIINKIYTARIVH